MLELAAEPPGFSRVLVVDDEEPMRHMLDLLLRREGYEVDAADSGEAAVLRLQDEAAPEIDVVLTDIMMPETGRRLSHKEGIALIRQWIAEMPGDCSKPMLP